MWLDKAERDAGKCPKCGGDRATCSDSERDWFPQRTICYADMEREAANHRYERLHSEKPWHDGTFQRWAEEPSHDFPYHFRDGVSIWVAPMDLTPTDDFLT